MSAPARGSSRRHPCRDLRAAPVWAAVGSVLLLSGCEFNGLSDVQLPGGAAADGHAYHVTVEFRDVLDLVPQSAVKVNDVTVGAVEKVQLKGWHARVRLRVSDSVRLPANATAELRRTSMLGEKYVSLARPTGVKPVGRLTDGDRIPLSRSGRNPEIEEVLSALSSLLNGGGVAQLKTITVELNKALHGREDRVKDLLSRLDTFVGGLDEQRTEITRALKGIDKLCRTLRAQRTTIGRAVDAIPSGLKVLADQRRDLTKMLRSLSSLGKVGTKVINASRADTIADLRNLVPILDRLNAAGDDLPNALEMLTTYPFPRNASSAIKGDYVNLRITADLDLKSLYGNLDGQGPKLPGKPDPELPEPPDVPDLPHPPDLPEPQLPEPSGLPHLPTPTPDPGGSTGSGSSGGSAGSGGGVLCPPVCHSSYTANSGGPPAPSGVDMSLAELMTRGMQP
ncbi:MCE family protein [Wenjunlia tyrosinilytica]|uniref:Mammalian cell entry protein n=1 Tax=Wenjunlia tyrosinilytica TaxID=1544741 RepID=A0A917ZX67_9ACTN|nr:MCE family protein [Wenjunlia tyrosinilytica]GGO98467.1 hypothetical protein GCM10012280_62680 [Wenjunlia tyrosinilytica]